MTDDIETLRDFIQRSLSTNGEKREAIAALERVGNDLRNAKAERDSLRRALDERWEADKKAARAIFASTGMTKALPSNKEVVAYLIAEAERLERERDSFHAKLFPEDEPPLEGERDHLAKQCATLCRENDSLRAKLARAIEQLEVHSCACVSECFEGKREGLSVPIRTCIHWKTKTVLSELSDDAPAQPSPPPQISDGAVERAQLIIAESGAGIVSFSILRAAIAAALEVMEKDAGRRPPRNLKSSRGCALKAILKPPTSSRRSRRR